MRTNDGSRERPTGIIRREYGLEYRIVTGTERLLGKLVQGNQVILRITSHA